jgi:pyridoxamine 5'-phosphate oxidase
MVSVDLSHMPQKLADIRREYGQLTLDEKDTHACPFLQFEHWFSDARLHEHDDPTAMVLSTVDEHGYPDARVVLLKDISDGAFVFYTNYNSTKSLEIQCMPYVALTFYWPKMARQVRVRGRVDRVSNEMSDAYFASRPLTSQLSAIASPQSMVIPDRNVLEEKLLQLTKQHRVFPRPPHWGGYAVFPSIIEFWQGRDSRLHDRIQYIYQHNEWIKQRLAP